MRVRWTLAILLMTMVLARPAKAGGPTPGWCRTPAHVTLVGAAHDRPDPAGVFEVLVTRFGNPINAASVVIDLSGCPDLVLCADSRDVGVSVNCEAKTARAFTNSQGLVSFVLLGASTGLGSAATLSPGMLKIYANGYLVGAPSASALDLDGTGGVAINDLAVWMDDFGSGSGWLRSDFDADGAVGINDLAVWLGAYGAANSAQGCTSSCP